MASERLPTRTVHIVDDDAFLSGSLERLLRSVGFASVWYETALAFLDAVPICEVKANPRICHVDDDVVSIVEEGADRQNARMIGDRPHRIYAVHDEIENDLLQLDPIGRDRRKIWMQVCLDGDAMTL